jgi:hypothetical protein
MDDTILSFLILLVISSFIKGALYTMRHSVGTSFNSFIDYYDHILDAMYLVVGCYILTIIKNPSPIYIITAIILIQKGLLHFIVFFRLYETWWLSPQNQDNLIQYKKMESMVTDYGILFVSLYLIYQIFTV